jgi:hypothetical protein
MHLIHFKAAIYVLPILFRFNHVIARVVIEELMIYCNYSKNQVTNR